MAQRGRPAGFRMDDSHRVKIQNSNILNALIEHVEGKREMGPSQVTAGIALLKKVMPDLTSNDHTNNGGAFTFPAEIVLRAASNDASDD